MPYCEYKPETLAKLQDILRMILRDFDAMCKKHGLRYFAGGGTAIGALRHGGMIPWDDDIDVYLLRGDFEKFRALAETEYGDKYYLLDARSHPSYPLPTTRWCLTGTVFREECMKHLDLPFGIFLDVYPFDPIPDDDREARRQWRRAWFWGKLMVLRQVPRPSLYIDGAKAKLVAAACLAGSVVLKILFRQRFLVAKVQKWARKSEGRPDCRRVAWMFDQIPFNDFLDAERAVRTRTVPFDGGTIELSDESDEYLRRFYGDYMVVPPPDRRHNHPPWKLDFGPWSGA